MLEQLEEPRSQAETSLEPLLFAKLVQVVKQLPVALADQEHRLLRALPASHCLLDGPEQPVQVRLLLHRAVLTRPLQERDWQRLELPEKPALLLEHLKQELQLQLLSPELQDEMRQKVRAHPHVLHGQRPEPRFEQEFPMVEREVPDEPQQA